MQVKVTRLQLVLLILGSLLVIASLFAPWYTLVSDKGEEDSVGAFRLVKESGSNYYLYFQKAYLDGTLTLYSPALPLVLVLVSAALEFLAVKYAPTLLSSLAMGACIGTLVNILRFDSSGKEVSDISIGAGLILSLTGCACVIAASFLERKDEKEEKTETPEKAEGTGEDEVDQWFEKK